MSTSLHDRLADLAADAPVPGPDDPASAADLWDRGRARHRLRVGTAMVVAATLVLLAVVGVWAWPVSQRDVVPADKVEGVPQLPDRFYVPSTRTPSAADHPIGPLVAVMGAERAGDDVGSGLVGVSAGTGEYRFLDLPGWLPGPEEEVALDVDGSRLAYWYGPEEYDEGGSRRVDGIAVYDTVSGEVVRHEIASDHGIAPEGAVWVGDEVWVAYGYYQSDERAAYSEDDQAVWDPATGDVLDASGPGPDLEGAAGGGTVLVTGAGRRVEYWDDRTLERDRTVRVNRRIEGALRPSPDGQLLAVLGDPDGPSIAGTRPGDLLVLSSGPEPDIRVARGVAYDETTEVVGWRDEDHVVVLDVEGRYVSVDVDTIAPTPATETLSAAPEAGTWSPGLQVAEGAWQWPTYDAPPPPEPTDPRLVAGAVAGVLLVGGLALAVWRRRARA